MKNPEKFFRSGVKFSQCLAKLDLSIFAHSFMMQDMRRNPIVWTCIDAHQRRWLKLRWKWRSTGCAAELERIKMMTVRSGATKASGKRKHGIIRIHIYCWQWQRSCVHAFLSFVCSRHFILNFVKKQPLLEIVQPFCIWIWWEIFRSFLVCYYYFLFLSPSLLSFFVV